MARTLRMHVLASLALPAFLVACAGEEPPPPAPPPPPPPAAAPAPAPEPAASASAAPAHAAPAEPAAPTPAAKYTGRATPESVLYDGQNDRYLVSNINGKPTDADNNGFISILSPDGQVTTLKW